MRILVTGASGFIGKHFLNLVVSETQDEIYALSRNKFRSGSENVYWISGDMADQKLIENLANKKFDKVFHFAWQGLPDRSPDFCSLNLNISKNLLSALSRHSSPEFNLMGSCLEYGDIDGVRGDYDSPQGKGEFAEAKIKLHDYAAELGCPVKWYRPFYVYGDGQPSKSLIPSLIQSLTSGKRPQIKSMSSAHDFIAVDDLVKGIYEASKSDSIFGSVNVGTGVLTTVAQIVSTFYKKYGFEPVEIASGISGLSAHPTKLFEFTSWKPRYLGIDGIESYYAGRN